MARGKLFGVGVGPGDPELMTIKSLRIIKESDAVGIPGNDPKKSVAFNIAREAFPDIVNKELLYLTTPMTKDKAVLEAGYIKAAEKIESLLDEGKNVALLTLGDPTIYSTYMYIQRIVINDGYEAEIISGVPSFCAVAARMGAGLADRDERLHIIPASYNVEDAFGLDGTKVFMKAGNEFEKIRQLVAEKGCKACMVENCGMAGEKIYRSIDEFPKEAAYYSIVILK